MGVSRGSEWEGSGKSQLESSAARMEVDGGFSYDLSLQVTGCLTVLDTLRGWKGRNTLSLTREQKLNKRIPQEPS